MMHYDTTPTFRVHIVMDNGYTVTTKYEAEDAQDTPAAMRQRLIARIANVQTVKVTRL